MSAPHHGPGLLLSPLVIHRVHKLKDVCRTKLERGARTQHCCLSHSLAIDEGVCIRAVWSHCHHAVRVHEVAVVRQNSRTNQLDINSASKTIFPILFNLLKLIIYIFWWNGLIPFRQMFTYSSKYVAFQLPEWLHPLYSLSQPQWCCAEAGRALVCPVSRTHLHTNACSRFTPDCGPRVTFWTELVVVLRFNQTLSYRLSAQNWPRCLSINPTEKKKNNNPCWKVLHC